MQNPEKAQLASMLEATRTQHQYDAELLDALRTAQSLLPPGDTTSAGVLIRTLLPVLISRYEAVTANQQRAIAQGEDMLSRMPDHISTAVLDPSQIVGGMVSGIFRRNKQ